MKLYKTVLKEATEEEIIEKSRFICHVCPVETREDAETFFGRIRKEHRTATHNVPAMILGEKQEIQWTSDDGEPQGTAGAPMLQMMVSEKLTNVALVVTRYFGGIKLGTGGLVRAYTNSAKAGLSAAGYCEVKEVQEVDIEIDYTYLSAVQTLFQENENLIQEHIDYGEKVKISAAIEAEDLDMVMVQISNITKGQSKPRVTGSKRMRSPLK